MQRAFGFTVALCLGLLCLGACGGSAASPGTPSTNPSVAAAQAAAVAAANSAPTNAWHRLVKVGDGLSIEVLGWQHYVNADPIAPPDSGTHYCAVECRFVNLSASAITLGLQTEIVDQAGMSWGAVWYGSGGLPAPEFQMEFTVAAGGARMGCIVYEIPNETKAEFAKRRAYVEITPGGDTGDYATVTSPLPV